MPDQSAGRISGRALPSLAAKILLWLIVVLIFAAPLLAQHARMSFTSGVTALLRFTGMSNTESIVLSCLIGVCAGAATFRGRSLFVWASCMTILALSAVSAETASRTWQIWRVKAFEGLQIQFCIEALFLVVIPVQIFLWRQQVSVEQLCRFSLASCAALQAAACCVQYLAYVLSGKQLITIERVCVNLIYLVPTDSRGAAFDTLRLSGLVRNPNVCALIILMGWPALLPTRGKSHFRVSDLVRFALLFICPIGILLTYSRAGYVGLLLQFLALPFLMWFGRRDVRLPALSSARKRFPEMIKRLSHSMTSCAVLFVLVGTVIGFMVIPHASNRAQAVVDTMDNSLTHRVAVFSSAIRLLTERPLAGWGPGFFNTLYNRFYKIPGVSYGFADVHSSILKFFMEVGIAGVALWLLLFWPGNVARWRVLVPRFAVLGVIGSFVPFLSDNPGCHLAVLAPLLWLLGPLVIAAVKTSLKRSSWTVRTAAACSMLWLASYFVPMATPDGRFQHELQRIWRGPSGELSYFIRDMLTGAEYIHNPQKNIHASSLTHLAIAYTILSTADQTSRSLRIPVVRSPEQRNADIADLPFPPTECKMENLLALMLKSHDNTAGQSLLSWLTPAVVFTQTDRAIGSGWNIHSDQSYLEEAARTLDNLSLTTASLAGRVELTGYGTAADCEVSARQAAQLLMAIVDSHTSSSELVRSCLAGNECTWGMTRYLGLSGKRYGLCANTLNIHNEVLYYRSGTASRWVACILRKDWVPRVGIDQPSLRRLAATGWKISLFMRRD